MTASATKSVEPTDSQPGLSLPGLDGSNPLGFLAAVGLWQVIAHAYPADSVRMRWHTSHSTWVPLINANTEWISSEKRFLKMLAESLETRFEEHPAAVLINQLESDSARDRRDILCDQTEQANHCNRVGVEWLAAFTSDATAPGTTSQLQTVRRDYFAGNLKSIIQSTQTEHLSRSLFRPWDYADALDNQSLHWDPGEDRRHAMQWSNPSGDPSRKKFGGMLGANRLALEALSCFPSVPVGAAL